MSPLETIGAIGDIHGEDRRLEAALKFLETLDVERVLAVGDIVDGPGDALRCCRLLDAHQVEAVRGNHDRWFLDNTIPAAAPAQPDMESLRRFLARLPTTRSYHTRAGRLLLCHGLGENDMNRLTPDDFGYALETNDELQALLASREYRFVVAGHTHRPMVKDFGGVTVINAGTLFREHEPCFAHIDFARRLVSFYDVSGDGEINETSKYQVES